MQSQALWLSTPLCPLWTVLWTTHAYTNTHTGGSIHTYMHTWVHTWCDHVNMHTSTHAHMEEHAHEHMNTHPLLHVHTRACTLKLSSFLSSQGGTPEAWLLFHYSLPIRLGKSLCPLSMVAVLCVSRQSPGLHTAPCLSCLPSWPSDCPFSS